MTMTRTILDARDVLERVQAVAPMLSDRASEIEAARRMPADLLDALKETGAFRLLLPRSHGGAAATLAEATEVIETLARADASSGWITMIGAAAFCDVAALPRPSFDALFAGDRDVVLAGAFNPMEATIRAVDAGYVVNGRWGFGSGCEHADWIYVNCIEDFVDGSPRFRAAVLPPEQVRIEDTWDVLGLRGTGSHHFRVDGVDVAADRTFVPLVDEPSIDAPVAAIPPPAVFSLGIASVAVGNARGALDDLLTLATGKVRLLDHAPLATLSGFHAELATADARLRAAGALVAESATELSEAVADGPLTLPERARGRAAAVWATSEATAVVDLAYRAGGGSALYIASPLQRRLRDAHAITQHFLVRPDTMTAAGAILAGLDDAPMVF